MKIWVTLVREKSKMIYGKRGTTYRSFQSGTLDILSQILLNE